MERYMYAKADDYNSNKRPSAGDKIEHKKPDVKVPIYREIDVGAILKDAEASKATLRSYENELEKLVTKTKFYKASIKNASDAMQNASKMLAEFRKQLLNLYHESWTGYKDLRICFEDEHTVWKNYIHGLNCIATNFRKYEASFEMIEDNIKKRQENLTQLKGLNAAYTEIKESKTDQPSLIRKMEKDIMKAERCYLEEHQRLTTLYPSILASKIECIFMTMEAYGMATKEFCSEIGQVNDKIMVFASELPRSNPTISIGQGENMIVLNVKLSPKTPTDKKPSDFGFPYPPPPPKF